MKMNKFLLRFIFFAIISLALVECSRDRSLRRSRYRFLGREPELEEAVRRSYDEPGTKPRVYRQQQSGSSRSKSGKWVSDDSRTLSIAGDVVSLESEGEVGEKFGAMWVVGDGVNNGEHYWQIYFDKVSRYSEVSVGITNKEKFKMNKGLLYGGHLGNGEKQLVAEFGPRFKEGDTVGILLSFHEESYQQKNLKVYFYLNKRCLGLALDIDSSLLPNAYPMIQFISPASASINKAPAPEENRREREPPEFKGVEGNWKIVKNKIKFDGELFDTKDASKYYNKNLVTLTVTPENARSENHTAVFHIVNSIEVPMVKSGSTWRTSDPRTVGKENKNQRLKTLEMKLFKLLRSASVRINNGNLEFRDKQGNNEVIFAKNDLIPTPFTKNPFSEKEECYCPCLEKDE